MGSGVFPVFPQESRDFAGVLLPEPEVSAWAHVRNAGADACSFGQLFRTILI